MTNTFLLFVLNLEKGCAELGLDICLSLKMLNNLRKIVAFSG